MTALNSNFNEHCLFWVDCQCHIYTQMINSGVTAYCEQQESVENYSINPFTAGLTLNVHYHMRCMCIQTVQCSCIILIWCTCIQIIQCLCIIWCTCIQIIQCLYIINLKLKLIQVKNLNETGIQLQ